MPRVFIGSRVLWALQQLRDSVLIKLRPAFTALVLHFPDDVRDGVTGKQHVLHSQKH